MFSLRRVSTGLSLAIALIGLSACSGSDDDDTTQDRDGGVRDSGPRRDAGPPRDAGIPDVGPRADAGHYCALNNQVQIDGLSVPVDETLERPMTSTGLNASTSCIDDPISPQNMTFQYCLFECADFMGYAATPADIGALRVAVFPKVDGNGDLVDPSYDRVTGLDRQPSERLDVGANFREVEGNVCASGWAFELGFSDLGTLTMFGEISYTLRVTSSTASNAWVDTYYPDFIRRNASAEAAGSNCGLSLPERTTPDVTYDFVVGARSVVSAAAAGGGVPIPGSDDYDDGMGNGFAMIETRDCANADGRPINNTTAGFLPLPLADYYPSDTYDLARADRFTAGLGRYLAIGFAGTTATSSLARDVHFGVGMSRDGTCTEEFGGGVLPIHPDALSIIRTNVETVIHGR